MNTGYIRARDTVFALNRFIKKSPRRRAGERKSHFENDRKIARSLMSDPNILGFGVGPKLTEGAPPGEVCLVVFVRKKLPKARLRGLVSIPKHMTLQTLGHKIRTDVQAWGGLPAAHSLFPGVSIGDVRRNSGTMTLVVRDRRSQKPLILGCSHVLALAGDGQVGDEVESPTDGSANPGPNVVGNLLRYTTIDRHSLSNAVDAAVASPMRGVDLSNDIPGIGTPAGIRDLTREGDSVIDQVDVEGLGAVSGRLAGIIKNIHVTTPIVYHQLADDPSVYFVDLVQYDAVCQEGDSGAAILDTSGEHRIVGMHIASSADGLSLFTHIRYVLDVLKVNFWDGTA